MTNFVDEQSATLINELSKEFLGKDVNKIEILKISLERVEKLKLNQENKEKLTGIVKEQIFKKVSDYFLKKFNLDVDTFSLLGDIAKIAVMASKGQIDINKVIDITIEAVPKVGKCCSSCFSCCSTNEKDVSEPKPKI